MYDFATLWNYCSRKLPYIEDLQNRKVKGQGHMVNICMQYFDLWLVNRKLTKLKLYYIHRVSKKTSTHIIGYKLRNSCPILIFFDTKIPHII